MLLKILLLLIGSLIIFTSFGSAFSESDPILITISHSMEKVILDGKWTNISEWKQSSHNVYGFDNDKISIHLRTAHFGDFIYIFIDPIHDLTLDENLDEVLVCFDGKNNKSKYFDKDDFCFSISLGNNEGDIFQGNKINETQTSMQKISNIKNFTAVSTVSDKNDRYSITPHPSYEFKIPIQLLERSDNYGFYFSVYDASLDKFYSWPDNFQRKNLSDIPFPSNWGDIISPDKSLPEINLPILIFVITLFSVILLQSKIKFNFIRSF